MSDHLDALTDDLAFLTRAQTLVERTRKLVEREIDRCPSRSNAADALDSIHHELDERVGSLGRVIEEVQEEIDAIGMRETAADLKWHHARVI